MGSVTKRIKAAERAEDGQPCRCGGIMRLTYTPISFRAVGKGVYESMVCVNCATCGIGSCQVIVEDNQ